MTDPVPPARPSSTRIRSTSPSETAAASRWPTTYCETTAQTMTDRRADSMSDISPKAMVTRARRPGTQIASR
ncbi:hypothetical protein N865_13130 [Intrasporangium oryzae NRRL B-24470]|uniref:Uncharacterized protein n=1 Tax=Intrasporangium oryzae NRRL B-24470 TaxID=1386089 RepID=W9G4F2_9MICO|nr:hypothetical protein N865_13130 [Intrasporangium oryzae NRRL B-24470]